MWNSERKPTVKVSYVSSNKVNNYELKSHEKNFIYVCSDLSHGLTDHKNASTCIYTYMHIEYIFCIYIYIYVYIYIVCTTCIYCLNM